MSIGWIYRIGILSSYILLLLEYELRRMLRRGGNEVRGVPYMTIILVALMFIVLGIIQWYRYRNRIYPVLGFIIGITTAQISFIFPHCVEPGIFKLTYFISFILLILLVLINWNSFYSQERFEINSRRLFRLASERIYETSDGYTGRPLAAGKITFTKDELLGFARFLHGTYVIRPFYFDNYVAMAFSMNISLVVIREHTQASYVRIDYSGEITVKNSEKAYRDYRVRLSFNQLCSSTSEVFIRFFDYYRQGFEPRIIAEIKSTR